MNCRLTADSTARLCLSGHHVYSAFEKFTPSTLHNVPILKPGELTWSDIGGLHDVRAVMQQTLLWPTKVIQPVNQFINHSVSCSIKQSDISAHVVIILAAPFIGSLSLAVKQTTL